MTEKEQYAESQYAEPQYASQPQFQQDQQPQQPQQQTSYDSYRSSYLSPNPTNMYGAPQGMNFASSQTVPTDKSKIAAGILGILLGAFGAHKFYLGYTKEAVIMLLVTLLTLGLGGAVMGVIGLVEGILYLTKTDVDFYNMYVAEHKGWF